MATPTWSELLARIGGRRDGVKVGRFVGIKRDGTLLVELQGGVYPASATTDEPFFIGARLWVSPTRPGGPLIVLGVARG